MIDLFKDKTILITGGTGFLGQALTREILKHDPQSIRIFSRDEYKHHKFQEQFSYHPKLRNLIGDVRDHERLRKAVSGCDYVIHAAALKRLDMIEYNVDESIKTNIIGTLNLVDACLQENVEKAIFISTDKACAPVNTYGACKFVSERIFTESNFSKGNKRTVFSIVRYGNVLDSTGSVIPFFKTKIKNKEKIPLTDGRMTRFIITPEEAVQLIFDSLLHSVGGEIFVPRLPAFRIIDLIAILKEKMRSSCEVEEIGIRPGEKIHEIMVNASEVPRTYSFRDRYVITSCLSRQVSCGIPSYLKSKDLLKEEEMSEYSSKDSVITKEELKALFSRLKLL